MECILAVQNCPISNKYSIHGLWFAHNSHQSCSLMVNKLDPKTIKILNDIWYSCPSKSNKGTHSFWQHEYCKHGKPYFKQPEDYFRAAITAYNYVKPTFFLYDKEEVRVKLLYNGIDFKFNLGTRYRL